MSELYTASSVRAWRSCARLYFFRYVLGCRTPSTMPMEFGTNAHTVLEAWYRAWQAGTDRLAAAFCAVDQIEDVSDADRVKLRVLAAAYDARWGAEDWEILAVEIEFRYWLGDRQIGGKIDALICERATGRVFVVEHKTSTADTSPGAPYWDRLSIDTQVSIYIDGASFGLDYEISGCIYDVIKRPQHDLRLATPEEEREYTKGKGCSGCGGSGGGKRGIVQGKGRYGSQVDGVPVEINCEKCNSTGWLCDDEGKPQAPRLVSRQRDTDETLDEFQERLAGEIAERADDFLARSIVVRLDSELPKMRQELIDTIDGKRLMESRVVDGEPAPLYPPNHDSCVRGRDLCAYFQVCAGRQDINDFPRGAAHSELNAA